jgi:glycosyltransferase involved in cell wall biosynthesis
MQSVLSQTFTDFEYLIVDGASTDGTQVILEKYAYQNSFLKADKKVDLKINSSRDRGIYDAMNKGLALAKGDFVLFLNCGDRFFGPKTLEKIAACITSETDILYGETMLVDDARNHIGTRTALTVQKLPEKLTWRGLKYGMVVCHQSFLVKRPLAPFYIDDNLAADIDWVIQCLKKAKTVTHTHTLISEYLMGGISKKRHRQSLKDRYAVLKSHYGLVPNFFNHIVITLRALWFKIRNLGNKTY